MALLDLPNEILVNIIRHIPARSLPRFACTCRRLFHLSCEHIKWDVTLIHHNWTARPYRGTTSRSRCAKPICTPTVELPSWVALHALPYARDKARQIIICLHESTPAAVVARYLAASVFTRMKALSLVFAVSTVLIPHEIPRLWFQDDERGFAWPEDRSEQEEEMEGLRMLYLQRVNVGMGRYKRILDTHPSLEYLVLKRCKLTSIRQSDGARHARLTSLCLYNMWVPRAAYAQLLSYTTNVQVLHMGSEDHDIYTCDLPLDVRRKLHVVGLPGRLQCPRATLVNRVRSKIFPEIEEICYFKETDALWVDITDGERNVRFRGIEGRQWRFAIYANHVLREAECIVRVPHG